jgi:hypothetical protein
MLARVKARVTKLFSSAEGTAKESDTANLSFCDVNTTEKESVLADTDRKPSVMCSTSVNLKTSTAIRTKFTAVDFRIGESLHSGPFEDLSTCS